MEIEEQNKIIAVEKTEAETALAEVMPILEAAKLELQKLKAGSPPQPRPCWLWTNRCLCTELPMGLELPWLKTQASVVRQPWSGHSAPAQAHLPGLTCL